MLELKDLVFEVTDPGKNGHETTRTIINGLNYTFEDGKIYAVTGPNGSGKSTVSKLVMGINVATSGSILLDGEDISGLSVSERANKGITYAFQTPARFKGITFRDLLSIAMGKDDDDSMSTLLSRVGICSMDFLDKPVDATLSGGEIKKIELATIIARNPRIAIYDEPDTGIDLWTIGPMVELLKKEQQEHKTTTIVVSHNKTFLRAADEIILIRDGRVAFTGKYEEAAPLLSDLSLCGFSDVCEGEGNAGCVR